MASLVESPQYDVFISYTYKDVEVVRRIVYDLQNYGIITWVDLDNLKVDSAWGDSIEDALNKSRIVVVVLSNQPLSKLVQAEVLHARNLQKPFFVATTEKIDFENIPWYLNDVPYINLQDDFENKVALLARSIQARLAESTSPTKVTLKTSFRDSDKVVELIAKLAAHGITEVEVVEVE